MMRIFNNKSLLSFVKNSVLILTLIFSVVQSQSVYAGNPSITQVMDWRSTGQGGRFIEWISQFNLADRQTLYTYYFIAGYYPGYSYFWNYIASWIDSYGGPTPGYTGLSSGGSAPGGTSGPAGGLNLANVPLFLSSTVEPNILFIMDDSGSMFWEAMVPNENTDLNPSGGLPTIYDFERYYYNPSFTDGFSSDSAVVPPVSLAPEAWLARNPIGNPSYYDPTKTYEPWPGLDEFGSPLNLDADPLATRSFPSDNPYPLETVNLTVNQPFRDPHRVSASIYLPTYYRWFDSDGDGQIEASDAHQRIEIKPGNEHLFLTGRTYAEELQNFANWFEYYRKREFAAKVAIGNVINRSEGTRMGLNSINAGQVEPIRSMSIATNKVLLLKKLYRLGSIGATPLRESLKTSGEMFKNSGSSGPILPLDEGGSCQQNFQILLTDGYWNGSSPSGFGNEDGDNSSAFDGGNYADGYSATLADVAMYYYETDLSSLADEVPTTPGIDEAAHQHLVTYTVAFGLKGALDPALVNPDLGEVTWPDPTAGADTTIDDLWHAAYNGRGEYLNASHPERLEQSLNTIIANIAERSATASAVAINSAKLTTDTVIYLAEFNTFKWQGEIYAYPIININTGELAARPTWSAGAKLNARDLVANPRTILTYDGADGVPFQWGSLSAFHKNDLDTTPSGSTSSVSEAQAVLDYIRGDRSNEGTGYNFRDRSSLLADVVNSGPVYVGEPILNWPDIAPFPTGSNKYSDFKIQKSGRSGVIYVGANDGMLHGFDESSGEEVLAYIPNVLFSPDTNSGLHFLSNPNYTHTYYNDLTPSISDVYLNAGSGTRWNSVLIGGLRGGGSGIYALDVTNPSTFSEANAADLVMWEFTENDDADLGKTYSKPQIALANNGKWVAIFGNGYNNLGSGESALFIVDIEAGVDGTWSAGDYVKLSTGSGDPTAINGLSTPALADLDGNGTVDRIYAGDLNGQLWVFDISAATSTEWEALTPELLFTTIGGRAITSKPALSKHPSMQDTGSNAPNVLVYFGSGKYLENSDKTDSPLSHYYGVWDSGSAAGERNLTSSDLVQQVYLNSFTYTQLPSSTAVNARVLSQNSVDYAAKHGWYFELPDTGERSITGAVVRFGVVFFNTFVPSNSACSGGGYGFKMAVDAETGGALSEAAFDANGDGIVDENDIANHSDGSTFSTITGVKEDGYLPAPVFIEDLSFTGGDATKVTDGPDLNTGRLSWQELLK